MLFPAEVNLKGVVGATWEATIKLFADANQTVPFDMTQAYIVNSTVLEMDNVAVLTTSAGLSIDGPNGVVNASMTPAQTSEIKNGAVPPWRLKLMRSNGTDVDFPASGICEWAAP